MSFKNHWVNWLYQEKFCAWFMIRLLHLLLSCSKMTVENVNISGHIALVFNQEMFLLFLPESMGNKVAKFNERRLRNNQWTSLLFFSTYVIQFQMGILPLLGFFSSILRILLASLLFKFFRILGKFYELLQGFVKSLQISLKFSCKYRDRFNPLWAVVFSVFF